MRRSFPRINRRTFLRTVLTLAGAGTATAAQARWVEPHFLDVSQHDVFLPDLAPALDGLRVAHLTDLHRGPITPDDVLVRALAATTSLKPDAVFLTGDFVHGHHRDAAPLARLLVESGLSPRLGVWGCLGNHDYSSSADEVTRALADIAGLRMLRNEAAEIAPGLWVAGIEDTLRGRPDARKAVAAIPASAAVVYLSHNPVGVFGVDENPWLVLAGHTHGGQICLPGLPPHFPPGMDGFPLIAGWGVFDRARLYVNRGVGMGMVPLRLNCRPEVALFTLHRGDALPGHKPGLTMRAFRCARSVAGTLKDKI